MTRRTIHVEESIAYLRCQIAMLYREIDYHEQYQNRVNEKQYVPSLSNMFPSARYGLSSQISASNVIKAHSLYTLSLGEKFVLLIVKLCRFWWTSSAFQNDFPSVKQFSIPVHYLDLS